MYLNLAKLKTAYTKFHLKRFVFDVLYLKAVHRILASLFSDITDVVGCMSSTTINTKLYEKKGFHSEQRTGCV